VETGGVSIVKWFVLFLLALLLHSCGLTAALYNNVFPLKYNLTSTAWFSRDGQTHSQSIVTACKVVDQRGSLLINFDITVTGERHWMRFVDDSILVLGYFNFCKWLEKPPEPTTRLTLAESWLPPTAAGILPIGDSHSYYFDNANDPGRLRLYSTTGLMAGHFDLVRVNPIQLAVGGARPTHTIDAAFPGLSRLRSVRTELHDSLERRNEAMRPARFIGLRAQLTQLVGGSRCVGGLPDADGPVAIPSNSPCVFVNQCDRGNATTICGRVLGGLTATVDPAFTTIRMSGGRFESGLRGDMVREQKLLDAKAPGEFRHGEFLWSPQVCIEDQCRVMKLSLHGFNERRLMYYPRQNRLLELFPIGYVASASRFRAEPGRAGGSD
jgi:hypothetical protein